MKPSDFPSRVALPLAVLALATACSDPEAGTAADAERGGAPVIATAARQVSQAGPPQTVRQAPRQSGGFVRTVTTAGGYTYLEVDSNGQTLWVATLATAVRPGQKIVWRDHALMRNFTSKALGREFGEILFVERIFAHPGAAEALRSGVVAESLRAAGYSFIRVDQGGESTWLAAPEIPVEVGQRITWRGGAPMRNFTSRSLDRAFDEILFVGAVEIS